MSIVHLSILHILLHLFLDLWNTAGMAISEHENTTLGATQLQGRQLLVRNIEKQLYASSRELDYKAYLLFYIYAHLVLVGLTDSPS